MRNFKKKVPFLAIAALFLVTAIGGTFAYFSQTSTVDNYLSANTYDSTITENFVPPTDGLAPDVAVTKEVAVANTGDIPLLVRVSYTEFWDGVENGSLVLGEDSTDGYYDGTGELDSVVAKATSDTTNWVYGGDGYYYYLDEVLPGDSTSNFIDSIMLKGESITTTTDYLVTYSDGTDFLTTLLTSTALVDTFKSSLSDPAYMVSVLEDETTSGTSGEYVLSITAETVQAIDEAAAAWEATATDPAVLSFLDGIIAVN